MTEVILRKFRFKPATRQEWMDWCQELNRRRDEVTQTLRSEGVLVEHCFLAADEDGIYYFVEAEDLERAQNAANTSRHPLDEEHRRHRRASVEEAEELRCLFYFKNR
jgi:hypothetical protein